MSMEGKRSEERNENRFAEENLYLAWTNLGLALSLDANLNYGAFRRSPKVNMQIDHEPMLFHDRWRSRAHKHGLHGGGQGSAPGSERKPPAGVLSARKALNVWFGTPNYSQPSTRLTLSLAQWLISSNCHFWTASYMQMLSVAQRFFPGIDFCVSWNSSALIDLTGARTLDGQLLRTSTLFSASWHQILI